MFKNLALSVLILVGIGRSAVSSVSLPLDWTTANGISRSNLNLNPIALRDAHNVVVDSLNPILSAITGYSSALAIASNQDLILKVDADANGTHKLVVTSNNLDSMFRIHESGIARLFNDLTVDSSLTVGKRLYLTDSLKLTQISASSPVLATDATKHVIAGTTTGTGSTVMLSASPTTTGTLTGAAANFSGNLSIAGTTSLADTVTLTQTNANIRANTADASDTHRITIGGGGGINGDVTRGAYLSLRGNENGTAGAARLSAGDVTGGTVILATGNDVARLTINETGKATFTDTVVISNSGSRMLRMIRGSAVTDFDNNGQILSDGGGGTSALEFNYSNYNASSTFRWRFAGSDVLGFRGGNVLIGTTTDGGQKLQVSGTANISGAVSTGALSATTGNFSSTLDATGKITGSDTVAAVLGFRAGNTAASNVNLYRAAANMWFSDDSMALAGRFHAAGKITTLDTVHATNGFAAGGSPSTDVNLYKYSSDTWKTDDALIVAGNITADSIISSKFYDEGSFTGTFTGGTGGTTGTAKYVRVGKSVTLMVPSNSLTSNANTYTMTGLPAGLKPAATFSFSLPGAQDNGGSGTVTYGSLSSSTGTLSFNWSGSSTGWTASGTKGIILPVSITYTLQ